MYVQFPNANFMKNTLFANNKMWNILFVFSDVFFFQYKKWTQHADKQCPLIDAFIFLLFSTVNEQQVMFQLD